MNTKMRFEIIQKRLHNAIGFSLVELLVVVAILAILGVVAYQALSGQTAKARDSRRLQDLATIESALQIYKQEKGFLPMPSDFEDDADLPNNIWGYKNDKEAQKKNTFTLNTVPNSNEIDSITTPADPGGGYILTKDGTAKIGAKGVIDSSVLPASRLSKVATDPKISNISMKASGKDLIDEGIGKYVYAVASGTYTVGPTVEWNPKSPIANKATHYQLACTLENEGVPITYVIGNYDPSIGSAQYPESLIGSRGGVLKNKDDGEDIPYEVLF